MGGVGGGGGVREGGWEDSKCHDHTIAGSRHS